MRDSDEIPTYYGSLDNISKAPVRVVRQPRSPITPNPQRLGPTVQQLFLPKLPRNTLEYLRANGADKRPTCSTAKMRIRDQTVADYAINVDPGLRVQDNLR